MSFIKGSKLTSDLSCVTEFNEVGSKPALQKSIFSPPKPPPPPDPVRTIEAQKEANQVAQITPQGTQLFGTYNPETGEFEARQTDALQIFETPFQEETRLGREDLSLRLLNQLLGEDLPLSATRTPESIEAGLPALSTDFSGDAARLEQATFDAASARLQPQFDRQQEQLEQRLADQGLPAGSEAYQEQINLLRENQGEQLSRLSLDAVQAGRQEQDRLARLGAALRGQAFTEQSGLTSLENQARAARFGEIGSLLGFAQPFTQFSTPQIDVASIINQGYQDQVQRYGLLGQREQQRAQDIAGLAQTGAMLFSDRRLKNNIVKVGEVDGLGVYEFTYDDIPEKRFKGAMADEVQKIIPDAVVMHESGYMMVDYEKLPFDMEMLHG